MISCFKNPKLAQYSNYIIIGVCSLLALLFFPMLGSEVGMAFVLPTSPAGWIVYIATKLCVGALNLVIFHSFVQQSKINAQDHENYIKAREILQQYKDKNYIPVSPKQFFAREYGVKGTTIFITSILSAIALSQAILAFDIATFLTYLFTIIGGIIAGILEMQKCYEWYITGFLDYAIYFQQKCQMEEQERIKQEQEQLAEEPIQLQGENTNDSSTQ